MKYKLFFFILIIFTLVLRLYGLHWDNNLHLHPDERFLTMVTPALHWPQTLGQYFDTATSPLNPHNAGFSFFVYGTFPIYFVKALADIFHMDDYDRILILGRIMSAIIDTGTAVLVWMIVRRITKDTKAALSGMLLYSLSVLTIQQAHFFTVDPYTTFFTTLVIVCLVYRKRGVLLGIALGLAIACKISTVVLFPVVGIFYLYEFFTTQKKLVIRDILLCGVFFVITLKIFYPYLFVSFVSFIPNPKLLANWKELSSFDNPQALFPPSYQWVNTTPYLYPFIQLFYWGLGIPQTIVGLIALLYVIKTKQWKPIWIVILAMLCIFGYQGMQYAKALRYFYPMYPLLACITAYGLWCMAPIVKKYRIVSLIGTLSLCVWPLAFMSVYARPHARIAASEWIYKHISPGSTITMEHWDDGLPLSLPIGTGQNYTTEELHVFDLDAPEKWTKLNQQITKADYLIMSSNRAYGAITRNAFRFPNTTKYYKEVFANQRGFTKVAEFTSRPNIPLPFIHWCIHLPGMNYGGVAKQQEECPLSGISIVDDYADETWTVYDHPKVVIFKRTETGTPTLSLPQ